PTINDLANLLAKAMEHPWVMGARRPARLILRNNPQWQGLVPHLRQLKIEVEAQEKLPLWDNAAAEYVSKLKASWIGRDVPIITVPQDFDEACPAMVRWVKAQGSIEIGFQEGRGFVVRALDGGGVVFESQAGESVGQTLTALERRVARADLPVQTVR